MAHITKEADMDAALHLTLIRKFTTQQKAESARLQFAAVLSPTANLRVVFLGPGRHPWGVVAESTAVDAYFTDRIESRQSR